MTSELSGFYRLGLKARRAEIAEIAELSEEELLVLSGELGLRDTHADRMVENALGVLGLPLGVCVNLTIDGEDILVPMAIEEPSVIAASSHAAKLVRAGGGLSTEVSPPHMIGQVQILEVSDYDAASKRILDAKQELIALANSHHKSLVAAGGGAFDLEVRRLDPMAEADPLGPMLVVHLIADVRDAMGANAINSMCERLAPRLAELSGGRVGLRILSNLNDRRTVKVEGSVPFSALEKKGAESGERLAHQIEEASVFAERDPYRAATHNKGIMNGVDAVLLAFGQDWRAVEAGAHSFCARSGRYTALARWRVEGDRLVGRMEIPMAVGTVGGVAKVHPTVQVAKKIASVENASQLARIAASVGLVQNLGALRALAAEGIQSGHMRLHARNVAVEAGADGDEVGEVARIIADRGQINLESAKKALLDLRGGCEEQQALGDVMERFTRLQAEHMPAIMNLISEVVAASNPAGSTLGPMLAYHMETGGKRLRALTPLLVAEAFGKNPADLIPLGATCEMLHNATLVHDDLQDGDTTRRGRATVWAHYGMPQAVNLGDAMFYYTILLSQRLDVPPVRREAIARRVLVDTLRVIDGQEREFALKKEERITLADYFRMVEGKTSGLFALPMAGAAEVLGMPKDVVDGLAEAAIHLGVVFQIQDDVLDLYGDKGREMRGSDIAEGKRSALVVHALEHAPEKDRTWLLSVLDKPREQTTEADVRAVMDLFERTGSLDFALAEMQRRRQAALSVPALQDHPRVLEMIGGLYDLFLRPIASLYDKKDEVLAELSSDPKDLEFCHRILPEVSRTFALSIHALPQSLRDAVAISYLLCRIVDTIEDEAQIDPKDRVRLFDQFDRTMSSDTVDPRELERMSDELELGLIEAEKELMRNAGAVFRSFRRLEKHQRDAIRPHVLEMSAGMREYTARADAAGELVLRDLDDLERYCYFVAGTVGNLLTALFEHTVPVLEERVRTAIRDRAVSFGLGLQMVNIVKDVAVDFERGDVFLPEALAKEMGVDLRDLLAPQKRQEALRVVRAVCARARKHLEAAAEYTRLWPVPQGVPVRQFCAVPLALALASLVEVENGRDTLRPGRVPKISRDQVMRLFQEVNEAVHDDDALLALFERCVADSVQATEIEVHVPERPPCPPLPEIVEETVHAKIEERRFDGTALVTGASTHLGANLIRRLLADQRDVRVLLHRAERTAAIDGLQVERIHADLVKALSGAETIYCCESSAEHVRTLLAATERSGVERVVVAARFGAPDAKEIAHECLKAAAAGLDVVVGIAPPAFGPHDYEPSREGKMLLDYAHGRLLGWIPGSAEHASMADLCEGLVLAMHRGKRGREYTFTTEHADVERIMHLFEEVSGRQRPRLRMPSIMTGLAKRTRVLYVDPALEGRPLDRLLAQEELGWRPTSIRKAIHEAYADFARRALVPRAPTMSVPDALDAAQPAKQRSNPRDTKVGAA